jgi:pyrimidine operon attenuation protein/uracil phosphoribosyltransferase
MARPNAFSTTLLDARALARALQRMALEIVDLAQGTADLVLVGIQRRGVELAERLGRIIEQSDGAPVPRGALDITLYRDDLQVVGPIVDDVLYTGRTIRAALDELADFGRPKRISLCVLVDRGGRELPIQADVVGLTVKVAPPARVDVLVAELDGRDEVQVVEGATP